MEISSRLKIEKKFKSNYLTKPKYSYGVEAVISILSLCLLASWLYWNHSLFLAQKIAASYKSVIENHEYWRLFTTTFVHADLKHLLSNSMMLSILIYFVSSFYGNLVAIGLSFIVAIFTNLSVVMIYGGEINLVGASGVVFYLWGFWMILYIFLQSHKSLKGRLLRMGAVFLILLIPTEYQPRTSYLAHYIGFGLGVLTGGIYYLINAKKLKAAEKWDEIEISEELSELDEIALSYDKEE